MKLGLVQQAMFGTLTIDFYGDLKGEFYMTREQIGRALEYSEPNIAIQKIHSRYTNRLEPLSVLTKLVSTDGKKYDTILYTAKAFTKYAAMKG